MSVRTIRKPPNLVGIMKAASGVHARAALLQAEAVMQATRVEHAQAIDEILERLAGWRGIAAPVEADWRALSEAGAEIVALCDPEANAALLAAARLLCDYASPREGRGRGAAGAAVFVDALKALAVRDADARHGAAVLAGLEALLRR